MALDKEFQEAAARIVSEPGGGSQGEGLDVETSFLYLKLSISCLKSRKRIAVQ